MKTLLVMLASIVVSTPIWSADFYVYKDHRDIQNHYIPSGYMGDYGDVKLSENHTVGCMDKSCIRVEYSAKQKQGSGWAGVYWLDQVNNWGNKAGKHNLNGKTKLTFWAYGEKDIAGRYPRIEEFKIGGITGDHSDSASAGIGPIVLNGKWEKYEIPLKGMDLSQIIGGFCFALTAEYNDAGAVFYIDEVRYEK